ncbi:hypothetical protein LCGC14_1147760 [marine sediment metagenome]|uniref:C2H2-type domain-containing protein n=1 Tax=marine sediment metagenome TaxID=412755 RepID=A0A0F9LWE5_9ZZZZ
MKDKVIIRKGCGWLEYKTEGTWTEEDGRRFCSWCSKMIRIGDRVLDHMTSPHRGGKGDRSYSHIGRCPS